MSDKSYWMAEALRLQGEVEEQRKTIHQLKSAAIDARWEIDRLREVMAHMQADISKGVRDDRRAV